MEFTFVEKAGPYTRYAEDAFDESIGKDITINIAPSPMRLRGERGKLIAADVSDDGTSVKLTIETSVDLLGKVSWYRTSPPEIPKSRTPRPPAR